MESSAHADRERKRMLALLLQDATLTRGGRITVQVRFRGGSTTELSLPVPEPAWRRWQTNPEAKAPGYTASARAP